MFKHHLVKGGLDNIGASEHFHVDEGLGIREDAGHLDHVQDGIVGVIGKDASERFKFLVPIQISSKCHRHSF